MGVATHDSSRVMIYFEKVDSLFFYQSNYLPAGERSPAKIVSTEPLNVVTVLSNVLARRVPGSQVDAAVLVTAGRNVRVYSGTKDGLPKLETVGVFTTPVPAPNVWSRPVLAALSY